jgi:hypothetical protein
MSARVEAVETRIREILAASGQPHTLEDGRARLERGSTAVFVSVSEWQDRFTVVEILCPVLREIECSEALLSKLNQLNEKLWFGKAYWRSGEVWLAHTLLGDHLDADELLASVGMLAVVADRADDELQARFKGQRWRDYQKTR